MNKHRLSIFCGWQLCCLVAFGASPILNAQGYLDDPRTDERSRDLQAPFNYFLNPSDAIGFMDAPKAFQLTADGAFSGYWGELTLTAGTPLKPLNSRARTLEKAVCR